jgi:hypothetical protein
LLVQIAVAKPAARNASTAATAPGYSRVCTQIPSA